MHYKVLNIWPAGIFPTDSAAQDRSPQGFADFCSLISTCRTPFLMPNKQCLGKNKVRKIFQIQKKISTCLGMSLKFLKQTQNHFVLNNQSVNCALRRYENCPQRWLWIVIPVSASMVSPKEHDQSVKRRKQSGITRTSHCMKQWRHVTS